MKVLFVVRTKPYGFGQIVKSQGNSLIKLGIHLDYFGIEGNGLWGYISSISKLKKHIRDTKPDIIHAHFSLSGIVAILSGARPIVVSFMGTDVKARALYRLLIRLFYTFFTVGRIIVKSEELKNVIRMSNVRVIPNGVDTAVFKPIDTDGSKLMFDWDKSHKHILFVAHPSRKVKNYALAKKAIDLINDQSIELHYLSGMEQSLVPNMINAADVVLSTSLWEGSPNVIKEAMACNRPIVTTEVGDVTWLIGNTQGCYITSFMAEDVAEKINMALDFAQKVGKTNGRERIMRLGLNSENIAENIIQVYKSVIPT